MFKLFISKDALTDLYFNHADAPTDWLKVIQKQRKVFLMDNQVDIDSDLTNPDSLLYKYLSATGKSFDILETSSLSKSDIQANHSKVLDNPCGCYLLDINKTEAETIQNEFGVICQSTSDYQDCPVALDNFSIYPEKDESGYGWDRFKDICSSFPSNALIINDRNLFKDKSGSDLIGLKNIEDILNALLPDAFGGEYHVGIIIGSERGKPIIKVPYDFKKIVDELDRIKNRLGKPYAILISLIMLDSNDGISWEKTHNRRIISNYYFITIDYKTAAFYNGNSTITQSIDLNPLYCKGLSAGGDAPEKHHHNTIEDYRFIVNETYWSSNPYNKFASGLNDSASIVDINHRFLK